MEKYLDSPYSSRTFFARPSGLTPSPLRVPNKMVSPVDHGRSSKTASKDQQPWLVSTNRPAKSDAGTKDLEKGLLSRFSSFEPDEDELKVRKQRRRQMSADKTPRGDNHVSNGDAQHKRMQTPTSTRRPSESSNIIEARYGEHMGASRSISAIANSPHGHQLSVKGQRFPSKVESLGRHWRSATDGNLPQYMPHASSNSTNRRHSIAHRVLSRIRHTRAEQAPALAQIGQSHCRPSSHHLISEHTTNLREFPNPPMTAQRAQVASIQTQIQSRGGSPVVVPNATPLSNLRRDADSGTLERLVSRKALRKPHQRSLLSARLSFLPEYHHMNFESGETIYVAAQLETHLQVPEEISHSKTALDFVVIIDNSVQCSPASLMAHCETSRLLASILDPETDQLGVISYAKETMAPSTVLPLSSVAQQKIKSALDGIEASQGLLNPSHMVSLLEAAQRMLMESSRKADTVALATYGHICLLTSGNPDDSFSAFPLDQRLTLHMLCAGPLPPRQQQWPKTNGWKLRSFSGKDPKPARLGKLEDEGDPFSIGLRRLVAHARTGEAPGCLTHIKWVFDSGPDTEIDDVLGATALEVLQPGEAHRLIFKVRCKEPKLAAAWLDGRLPSPKDMEESIGEVARMFAGLGATELITASVSYEHSLLPSGTTRLSSAKICAVKRYLSSPEAAKSRKKSGSLLESGRYMEVQRRLAFHLFSDENGIVPMDALQKIIQDGGGRMSCPEYVSVLMKERQYMSRFDEGCISPGQADVHDKSEQVTSVNFAKGNTDRDPSNRLARVPKENARPAKQDAGGDAARKIWSEIRVRSKPSGIVTRDSNIGNGGSVKVAAAMIETALRNKRSLGEDTIRSLSSGSQRATCRVAPWL